MSSRDWIVPVSGWLTMAIAPYALPVIDHGRGVGKACQIFTSVVFSPGMRTSVCIETW